MRKYLLTMAALIALAGCTIKVAAPPPPPPPQTEVMTVVPYPDAVWVGGGWVWHPGYHRYYWRRGYWRHR